MRRTRLPNLSLCIILDLVGCTSYLLPFFGEAEDLLWAPLSSIIFYCMFGRKLGIFGGLFSFVEEISPGLDFIPTFTIAWFFRKYEIEKTSKRNLYKSVGRALIQTKRK